jgi:Bacterial Ig domain/Putative Ig domain/Immunoglobulin domain
MNRWVLFLMAALLASLNSGCAGMVQGSSNPAPVAPSITAQPASQTVSAGQAATFFVTATGTAPLTYQWKKNGAAIAGANSPSYTASSTTNSESGTQFSVVVSNSAGNATSNTATLTVSAAAIAPSITAQPASQTVTAGQTATFSVAATGTAPLTYQWKKNGAAIAGANSSSYTVSSTTSSESGEQFSVVVSNSAGNATSNAATLTVSSAAVAPSITAQPASQTVTAGQTATFSVAATGTAPLTYQWEKNGAAITGANSSSYTMSSTTSSESGEQFSVVVSNSAGNATSTSATLTVNSATTSLQISTTQLPGGFVSGGYSSTLAASGGSSPYTWSLTSGSLPNGLTFSSAGVVSGTLALAGSFSFTVQVKDASSNTASKSFSVSIASPTPSVAITAPTTGSTVSGALSVSGTASDSVSVSSVQVAVDGGSYAPASGTTNWSLSVNTDSLANGAHTLTAQVTDAAGITATSSALAITVNNGSTASNCTLFASPSGNDSNSGSSSSEPKTFTGAAAVTLPGSVVCLLAGTYNLGSTFSPTNSGSSSAWIVYQAYGNGAVNFVWTAGATGQPMFEFGGGSFPSGAAYLEFKGLNLNGQNDAADGFFCVGGHHLSFIGNSISNTGGSGVGAVDCDYLTSDHNMINHNGYLYGWTSAISYNSAQWFDNYAGFHNIISNNIITGEYDGSSNHTDGNGIILDLSNGTYNSSSANTPPALIINNVVYGNGGRCIEANIVTNFWVVNNTCYKNDLDTTLGNVGSFTTQNSNNGYFINNIVVSVATNNPSYDQEGTNANIQYYADLYYGSPINFSYSSPSQLIDANPLFLSPPVENIAGYATSLAPSLLSTGLTLQAASPAYNRGIDPSTLSGVPANIVSDLKKYIYTDINGKARPQGGGSDLGAYQ